MIANLLFTCVFIPIYRGFIRNYVMIFLCYNQDGHLYSRGSKAYDTNQEIQIPATVEPGDYHFVIRVTDQTGNQQLRAMAIKIK